MATHPQTQSFPAQVAAFLAIAPVSVASIGNLSTELTSVGDGDGRIPVSVNSSERGNAWVCSPHTAYCRYAIEELQRFGHPWLTRPLTWLCRGLDRHLWDARIDAAVGINNWLLSTNLYPALDLRLLRTWIDEAIGRWPRHAIWFRSLNARHTNEWLLALSTAGLTVIPSRQVYLYDSIDATAAHPQNLRRDLHLLHTTSLAASDAASWSREDFARAAELYALLYLEKYSHLNPAYSADFLHAWQRAGLLRLTGYRDARGVLQAVVGTFIVGRTSTAPIVGYDTSQPKRLGLYRLLMATVYQQTAKADLRLNLSAGAAQFKRLRGGVATSEFSAVFAHHLPAKQRRAISVLARLATRIGVPFMRRFDL